MNARVYNRSEVLKGIIMKRHVMNLTPAPLRMIREGRKTIELRLYDEKRKQISIGDIITFVNTEDKGKGLGLNSMQYRANQIGAAFVIKQNKPNGTCVQLSISNKLLEVRK